MTQRRAQQGPTPFGRIALVALLLAASVFPTVAGALIPSPANGGRALNDASLADPETTVGGRIGGPLGPGTQQDAMWAWRP